MQQRLIWIMILLIGGAFVVDVGLSGFGYALERVGKALDIRLEDESSVMDLPLDFDSDWVEPIPIRVMVEGGRVRFEWEPVVGAAEYRVAVRPQFRAGYVSKPRFTLVAETQATFVETDLNTLRWSRLEPDWEGDLLHPGSLIGLYPMHSAALDIQVNAYDEDGTLIGASYGEGGYFGAMWRTEPTYIISDLEISAEVALLEVMRYIEGLFGFRDRLIRDPDDEEALHVLFRAHYFGIDRSGRLRDLTMAHHYGERLLALMEPGPARDGYEALVAEIAAALGTRKDEAEVAK